jgi:hypothetical protein
MIKIKAMEIYAGVQFSQNLAEPIGLNSKNFLEPNIFWLSPTFFIFLSNFDDFSFIYILI